MASTSHPSALRTYVQTSIMFDTSAAFLKLRGIILPLGEEHLPAGQPTTLLLIWKASTRNLPNNVQKAEEEPCHPVSPIFWADLVSPLRTVVLRSGNHGQGSRTSTSSSRALEDLIGRSGAISHRPPDIKCFRERPNKSRCGWHWHSSPGAHHQHRGYEVVCLKVW